MCYFVNCREAHRDLHSFPTRRSSDLGTSEEHLKYGWNYALLIAEGPSERALVPSPDRKSTRLNSSHVEISYAVFCLKKKRDCDPRDVGYLQLVARKLDPNAAT